MKKNTNLNELNVAQLKESIETSRRELFSLKLTAATSHVKDNSRFRKLRKNIAKGLTFLNQKLTANIGNGK